MPLSFTSRRGATLLFLAAAVHAGWPLPAQSQAASPLRVTLLPPPVDGGLVVQVSDPAGQPLAGDRIERIEVMSANTLLAGVTQWDVVRGARQAQGGELRVEYRPPALPARQFFVAREIPPAPPPVVVTNAAQLRNAAGIARPGTVILLGPGTYPGGFFFTNLQGTEAAPIVIGALDPQNPPVIQGGANGIQLTDPAHLELRDLVLRGATGNGLNIDDGGSFNTPAHHLILRRLRITDVGPTGNRDGIKLSGVVSFTVEGCTVERWGNGGSAVDMVGCHSGLIVSNQFRYTEAVATGSASGVQAKGGSRDVVVRRNRFEYAGARAVNIGGSTGLEFFRPPLDGSGEHWEAKDIRVEGNTFVGSSSPVAFVGVDGADVRFNTFYRPQRWVMRILQENTAAGFVACRGGRFTDNLVAFDSTQWSAGGINVGGGTAPATFQFARNWWYCLDAPARSRPTLPVSESAGVYGTRLEFRDASAGDLRLVEGSPAHVAGAEALVVPAVRTAAPQR